MSSNASVVSQSLLTLEQALHRLLPHGSNPDPGDDSIEIIPFWPPDLFAVTATIVDMTGSYSFYRYTSGPEEQGAHVSANDRRGNRNRRFFTEEKVKDIEACSRVYGTFGDDDKKKDARTTKAARQKVQAEKEERAIYLFNLWSFLLDHGSIAISELADDRKHLKCRDALMELLSTADSAAANMGFSTTQVGAFPCAEMLIDEYQSLYAPRGRQKAVPKFLKQLPASICLMVPATEACVQPKTMTPQCGCTLRSLSHNLALLPPSTKVLTEWILSVQLRDGSVPVKPSPYNILLVPYPYFVEGGCIRDAGDSPTGISHVGVRTTRTSYFEVRQQWLDEVGRTPATRASRLGGFVAELAEAATDQVDHVDMVVFPELALDKDTSDQLAKLLLSRVAGLECLIAGVLVQTGELSMNTAQTYVVDRPDSRRADTDTRWQQAKHHRWKLDAAQIRRYHLGGQLNPVNQWWEHIDLRTRQCHFFVFRHGMSLATLICEDLARVDPVQAVIRSVGPNLVIALLMDGAQLERRWGGRYATVLADDPGSAVLTLTSVGMVARSVRPGEPVPREIALWKGYEGVAQELKLPYGDHALLLTVTHRSEEHFTLDGRSDNGVTSRLEISGVHGIRYPGQPPEWARLPD